MAERVFTGSRFAVVFRCWRRLFYRWKYYPISVPRELCLSTPSRSSDTWSRFDLAVRRLNEPKRKYRGNALTQGGILIEIEQ